MHIGRSYRIRSSCSGRERISTPSSRSGLLPVFLYQTVGLKWLTIPWTAVALLGTATAFIVGFKNVQTYNRSWEARQIWGNIVGYRFFYPENSLT